MLLDTLCESSGCLMQGQELDIGDPCGSFPSQDVL